jgi:hypothetical protein
MAYKLIDDKSPSSGSKEGLGGALVRNFSRVAPKAFEAVVGLPGNIENLGINVGKAISGNKEEVRPILPTSQELERKRIGKYTQEGDYDEEYFKPQNVGEEILDLTASSLPIALGLGSGSVGQIIGRDLAASTVMKGAEKAGFEDPISQTIAGIAGGSGFNKAFGKFFKEGGNIATLASKAQEAQKKLYDTERQLGKSINVPARSYQNKLIGLSDKIRKTAELEKGEKTELLDKIKTFLSDTTKDKVNASQLFDRKKELNALWPKPHSKVYGKYLGQLQKNLFEELDSIGAHHPEWAKAWKTGDRITSALNYKSSLREIIESYPLAEKAIKSPIAASVIGLLTGGPIKAAKGFALGTAGYPAILKSERVVAFLKAPETREILGEVINESLDRNIPAFTKALHKLDKEADSFDTKNPSKRFKLVD